MYRDRQEFWDSQDIPGHLRGWGTQRSHNTKYLGIPRTSRDVTGAGAHMDPTIPVLSILGFIGHPGISEQLGRPVWVACMTACAQH